MNLHVTFLTGEYPPMQGGIADHTASLANHLAPLNVAASVLITHRWQETKKAALAPLRSSSAFLPDVHPVLPDWGWRCWPAIISFLKQYRPDILHIQYQAAAFELGGWVNWLPWYLKKRGVETRLVTTFHDLRIPYIFPKAGSFRWKSILALARYSDAVICTDRENLQTVQDQLGIKHNQLTNAPSLDAPLLTLIPLGNNVEPQPPAGFDRHAWRKKYQVQENTVLLAYFGFLNESKGAEELIEALALLRNWGIDARLLFIGGDIGHADPTNVAYAQRIQKLIDDHALTDFVYRTGYVELPEVSANLLAADAVVMPYRDGVSFRRTTLIAALRHGCPMISTTPDNPSLIPEIQHGENMLLAPPHDAAGLAKTIALLSGDQTLQKKLSTGAKALGDLFEWDKIATETKQLYMALANQEPQQR